MRGIINERIVLEGLLMNATGKHDSLVRDGKQRLSDESGVKVQINRVTSENILNTMFLMR